MNAGNLFTFYKLYTFSVKSVSFAPLRKTFYGSKVTEWHVNKYIFDEIRLETAINWQTNAKIKRKRLLGYERGREIECEKLAN